MSTEHSLEPYHTLASRVEARQILELHSHNDIEYWFSPRKNAPDTHPVLLGGGSNVVFTGDIEHTVLLNRLKGVRFESIDEDTIRAVAAAGESWHELVRRTTQDNLYGLENLSLIPGTVGAAPVQNIGAYGVELKDVLDYVEVYDRQRQSFEMLSNEDCQFGYRDSVFKRRRSRYVITAVAMRLSRLPKPVLTYGELKAWSEQRDPESITANDISDEVIRIRQNKLPDPAEQPNVGSFFKNPIVDADTYARLSENWPDLVAYVQGDQYKLAAGWMIDALGWKAKRMGHAHVHAKQALVLINDRGSKPDDFISLARAVREDVERQFGVVLEVEPVIFGDDGVASSLS